MNPPKELKLICDEEDVKIFVQKAPRYVLPFLLDYEDNIALIRKEGNMPEQFIPVLSVKQDIEEDLELTGSPLYTSLDDSLINNPLAQTVVNINEYYNHSPVPLEKASHMISSYALLGNPTFEEKEPPIWVLCDANDPKSTVLLMYWRRDDGWISRGCAALVPSLAFKQKQNPSLDAMLKEHVRVSKAEKNETSYLVKACYSLNESGRYSGIDEFSESSSSLKMHFSWKRAYNYLSMPPVDAASFLEVNMTVGCEGALLWQDLEKLQEISCLVEENNDEKETQLLMTMATMNATVISASLRGQLHAYIISGKLPESMNNSRPHKSSEIGVSHVLDIFEDIVECRRSNIDMAEVVWCILKDCSDLVELNSCFKMMIREAASRRFVPMILPDNETSIAKVIQGLQTENILQNMRMQLKGNESLRLLWELGQLKLQRDFKHIFPRLALNPLLLEKINELLKTSPVKTRAQRDVGIENLMEVQSVLEILMLLKSGLHLDEDSLICVANSAISKLLSTKSGSTKVCHLDQSLHKTVSLMLPVHTKISVPLVKGSIPLSWSFTLTTEKKRKKIVTVFYESSDAIFPPEVENKGDQTLTENKDGSIVKFTLLSDLLFRR